MHNRQLEIIKGLNDNRSKLSALYSLYNSALITAEDERAELGTYYEQMIDFKHDLNAISNEVFASKKADRVKTINKNQAKIKKMGGDAKSINSNFSNACGKYRLALQDCGPLKTEYKHNVNELCKEFKGLVNEDTDSAIIKGYKQQVKIIKAILDKIEFLIADYNIKKNKVEEDNQKFTQLYQTVNSLITQLQGIA